MMFKLRELCVLVHEISGAGGGHRVIQAPPPPPPPPPPPVAAPSPLAPPPAPAAPDKAELDYARNIKQLAGGADVMPELAQAALAVVRLNLATKPAKPDNGQTIGINPPLDANGKERDRNFGHSPVSLGPDRPGGKDPGASLYAVNVSDPQHPKVVWADNGKALTGAQWATMSEAQKGHVLNRLEPGQREAFKASIDAEAGPFAQPTANPAFAPGGAVNVTPAKRPERPPTLEERFWNTANLINLHNTVRTVLDGLKEVAGPAAARYAAVEKQLASLADHIAERIARSLPEGSVAPHAGGPELKPGTTEPATKKLPAAEPEVKATAGPDAPGAPDAEVPSRLAGALEAGLGGLGMVVGAISLYEDTKALLAGKEPVLKVGGDMVGHVGDVSSNFVTAASGASKLPFMMALLGPGGRAYVTALSQSPATSAFSKVGAVGLVVGGATNIVDNGMKAYEKPDFGNVLGLEIGAMKVAAGGMMHNPSTFVQGSAVALTAGALDGVKWAYDANPTVKATFDGATDMTQPAVFGALRTVGVLPPEVSPKPVKLPPDPPYGSWAEFIRQTSPETVAAYVKAHGQA